MISKALQVIFLLCCIAYFSGCRDKAIPCVEVERTQMFPGSEFTLINCSESEVRVDFNKADDRSIWESFDERISYSYPAAGTYFLYFEFNQDGFITYHDMSLEVKAPTKSDLQGIWRLWSFEDRTYGNNFPGLNQANPFESILEETWLVNATWEIAEQEIIAKPDLNMCLLCFGPEPYSYFDDQAELSVGSILSNIVFFNGDSMILDAGYGGDPFLIYMSKLE